MDKKQMQHIKSRFFALRNGVIADRLRKSGSPYKIIFGLLLPQIEMVAGSVELSVELAETLWANTSTRESRLMATMVYPLEAFTVAKAKEWVADCDTVELVDLLCFRLVRHLPEAEDLLMENLKAEAVPMMRYFALRLAMTLLVIGNLFEKDKVYAFALEEGNRADCKSKMLCRQVQEEIEWQKEEEGL